MDLDKYVHDAIFCEKEIHRCFYELMWANFKESGFIVTDEEDNEIDCVVKAVAMENIIGEFSYRLYDVVNEIDYEDMLECLATLDIYEDDIVEYAKQYEEVEIVDDFTTTAKNLLDYITEITAKAMLEEFSADDIFDYLFCATYSFEQDFTFEFEDSDEFQAFVDAQSEKLDDYKEEYPSVMNWVEQGMIC